MLIKEAVELMHKISSDIDELIIRFLLNLVSMIYIEALKMIALEKVI